MPSSMPCLMSKSNQPSSPPPRAERKDPPSRQKGGPSCRKRRVVVECDPALYRRLKARVATLGMTMRSWFEREAKRELKEK